MEETLLNNTRPIQLQGNSYYVHVFFIIAQLLVHFFLAADVAVMIAITCCDLKIKHLARFLL
jgi:hypothetical protein